MFALSRLIDSSNSPSAARALARPVRSASASASATCT